MPGGTLGGTYWLVRVSTYCMLYFVYAYLGRLAHNLNSESIHTTICARKSTKKSLRERTTWNTWWQRFTSLIPRLLTYWVFAGAGSQPAAQPTTSRTGPALVLSYDKLQPSWTSIFLTPGPTRELNFLAYTLLSIFDKGLQHQYYEN